MLLKGSGQTGSVFMASQDDVQGLTSAQVSVGTGAYVGISGGPGVNSVLVEYRSGGTCAITGYTGLGGITGGFIINAGQPVVLGGSPNFWLTSQGATSIVQLLKTTTINLNYP